MSLKKTARAISIGFGKPQCHRLNSVCVMSKIFFVVVRLECSKVSSIFDVNLECGIYRMTKQKKEGRKRKIISEVDEEKEVKREAKVMHDDALDAMDVEPDDNTIGMDTILPTRQTYAEQVAVLLRSYDIVLIDVSFPSSYPHEVALFRFVSNAALFYV